MKWQIANASNKGDVRIKNIFTWKPTEIKDYVYWLEKLKVKQMCVFDIYQCTYNWENFEIIVPEEPEFTRQN